MKRTLPLLLSLLVLCCACAAPAAPEQTEQTAAPTQAATPANPENDAQADPAETLPEPCRAAGSLRPRGIFVLLLLLQGRKWRNEVLLQRNK